MELNHPVHVSQSVRDSSSLAPDSQKTAFFVEVVFLKKKTNV